MTDNSPKGVALRWVELYNDGTPDFYGSDRFLELYAEDVDWREMPTRLYPSGRSGNLVALRGALQSGQSVGVNRRVELHEVVANDDHAALRYTWEATVAADGLPVARGARMRLAVAQFITVRAGKIVASTEYCAVLPSEGGSP